MSDLEGRTNIAVSFQKFVTDRNGCQILCHHLRNGDVVAFLGSRLRLLSVVCAAYGASECFTFRRGSYDVV